MLVREKNEYLIFLTCIFCVARGTATYAVLENDHAYRLHGYKWFSSATDADMAFTLARVQDESSNVTSVSHYESL